LEDTNDLRLLSGYEETDFEPERACTTIRAESKISPDDTLLEIGCGAGYLAQYLSMSNPKYIGVDLSQSLVTKHISLFGNAVLVSQSNDLPFGDKSVDHVVCVGVFQYFDSMEYMVQTLREMERVAKKSVFVGNIRCKISDSVPSKYKYILPTKHFIVQKDMMPEKYRILEAFYDPEHYFNAHLILDSR
jgi:ubiquinone/menaquinone biosynthesis C-methylase UbiE